MEIGAEETLAFASMVPASPVDKKRAAWGNIVMETSDEVIFLLDVDNTLLDNDRIIADLDRHLSDEIGFDFRDRYWRIFDSLRAEQGYTDYLGVLQRCRMSAMNDPRLLLVSSYLMDYPFSDRLYPGALDVIEHLQNRGPTVILSDGDLVLQPRKIQRSGIWDAARGRILLCVHKEQRLDEISHRYPAEHYIVVDDKLRILSAMKAQMKDRLTTVFPRQGRYALDPEVVSTYPPADLSIERVSDLLAPAILPLDSSQSPSETTSQP